MNKIIVTGGTGYIGSHTVVELIQAGYTVHIIDNLSNSNISILDRIEQITSVRPSFSQLNLEDSELLNADFQNHNDAVGVIHFAALKSVGESVSSPLKYYNNNIVGLLNLLQSIKNTSIPNLVFSSSATVYGSPERLPVDETTKIGFTPSPYGATKQMCERIIEDFTHSFASLKAISLRYFNPVGAHKSHLIGENPTGVPNNLMPYITQTAAGIREELSVFGSDYDTHDGTAIRDYVHVSDVATAHVKAIDYLTTHSICGHDKINIGTGKGLSVLDAIRSFEKTSNMKLNYQLTDRREGDVMAVYADATLAKEKLGWESKYDIDDMTRSAWEWEKKLRGL